MSTDNQPASADDATADADSDPTPDVDAAELHALRERVDELEQTVIDSDAGSDEKKMTIVATQGSFDMAYPPLILGSTAAAFGWDVVVFHTFWGLDILHEEKSKNLKLSAVGNPNMPVPNALAAIPGMDRMATRMMEKKIDENGTATIEELIDLSLEQGVDLQACQMTIELMDYDEDDFYDGVTTGVGAATALQHMADSDVQLLV
ncbi:DsrE/DsrF/DrsH-like family protein [Halobacteria archaeon AArc-dxtr1]|nr:DsrE/DsrF/DrsH-like family protein [Halobacteria archaeon AArc-dxtr1]